MGRAVPRTQQHGQCLVGGIEEARQRVKPEATLVVRSTSVFLCVGIDQGGIEIDDQRSALAHRAQPGRPGHFASFRPGRSYGSEPLGVDRIDHPTGRWCGRHGTKESGLIA
jgi:hypothetical protein